MKWLQKKHCWARVCSCALLALTVVLAGCNEEPVSSDSNQYKISSLDLSAYNPAGETHPSIIDAIVHDGFFLVLMARYVNDEVDAGVDAYLAAFTLGNGEEVDFELSGEGLSGIPLVLSSPVHLSAADNLVLITATGRVDGGAGVGECSGGVMIVDIEKFGKLDGNPQDPVSKRFKNCTSGSATELIEGRFLRSAILNETHAYTVVEHGPNDHRLYRFGPESGEDQTVRVRDDILDDVVIIDLAVHRVNTPGATVANVLHVLYVDDDDEAHVLALNTDTDELLDSLALGEVVPKNLTYFQP